MEDVIKNATDSHDNITMNENSTYVCNETEKIQVTDIFPEIIVGSNNVLESINIVVIPTCLIAGLLGNFVTIILMCRKTFSNISSRYFLIALAFSDIIVLCSQPLKSVFVIRLIGADIRSLSEIGCKIYYWIHKTGKMTSSWFVVCLSLERLAAVSCPFKVKLWFSKQNMMIGITAIYFVMAGFNAGYSYCTKIDQNGICNPDVYDKNDKTAATIYGYMLNIGSIFHFILPLIILFTVTPLIIFFLVKISRQHSQLQPSTRTRTDSKYSEITRPTRMLTTIIVAYMVFVTPFGIARIMANYINGTDLYDITITSFLIFRDISLILELINYTINFYLYVCSSKQFRDDVTLLLCKKSDLKIKMPRRHDYSNA